MSCTHIYVTILIKEKEVIKLSRAWEELEEEE